MAMTICWNMLSVMVHIMAVIYLYNAKVYNQDEQSSSSSLTITRSAKTRALCCCNYAENLLSRLGTQCDELFCLLRGNLWESFSVVSCQVFLEPECKGSSQQLISHSKFDHTRNSHTPILKLDSCAIAVTSIAREDSCTMALNKLQEATMNSKLWHPADCIITLQRMLKEKLHLGLPSS